MPTAWHAHHEAVGTSATIARWRTSLRNDSGVAARIAAEIASWGQEWLAVGDETPVHEALSFLANLRDRLDYARTRQQGRLVSNGAVEATCKSPITVRIKRPGA